MSDQRWLAICRLATSGCIATSLAGNGSFTLAVAHAILSLGAFVLPGRISEKRATSIPIHIADLSLLSIALVIGMVPPVLPLVHLIVGAIMVFGTRGGVLTAVVLFPVIPMVPPASIRPLTLIPSVLAASGMLVSAFERRTRVTAAFGREAIEHERYRLARELHDGPLQSVIGAKLLSQSGDLKVDSAVGDSLEAVRLQIQSLIRHLRPPLVSAEESRFTTRLHLLAIEVKQQWNVEVEIGDLPHVGRLPAEIRREVRQLIRECVVNAARHSQGRRIVVSGSIEDDALHLVVRDDGHGFSFKGSFDLDALRSIDGAPASVRERLEEMNGELTIESSERGSTLWLRIPLQEAVP